MNPLLLYCLIVGAKKCDEEMSDALSSNYSGSECIPSKFDLFMNKHKIINAIFPYVVGFMIVAVPTVLIILYLWIWGII